jgi:hypothetical protein
MGNSNYEFATEDTESTEKKGLLFSVSSVAHQQLLFNVEQVAGCAGLGFLLIDDG